MLYYVENSWSAKNSLLVVLTKHFKTFYEAFQIKFYIKSKLTKWERISKSQFASFGVYQNCKNGFVKMTHLNLFSQMRLLWQILFCQQNGKLGYNNPICGCFNLYWSNKCIEDNKFKLVILTNLFYSKLVDLHILNSSNLDWIYAEWFNSILIFSSWFGKWAGQNEKFRRDTVRICQLKQFSYCIIECIQVYN